VTFNVGLSSEQAGAIVAVISAVFAAITAAITRPDHPVRVHRPRRRRSSHSSPAFHFNVSP
jgi:hypothetical protein